MWGGAGAHLEVPAKPNVFTFLLTPTPAASRSATRDGLSSAPGCKSADNLDRVIVALAALDEETR